MGSRITPEEIKRTNRQQIYEYIYHNARTSSQDISTALHLSRPTVASYLSSMEEEGLIHADGLQKSTQIGRKAVAYSIVPDYRVAIGVELRRTKVNIIAVDLYGQKIALIAPRIRYSNEPDYHQQICEYVLDFIRSLKFSTVQVLGIGFSLQALASPDGRTIVYGEIFRNTGLQIDVFQQWLPYPCAFLHDPEAAALSELNVSPDLQRVLYLSLSAHLGGAIVLNRHVESGKHGHNGTFEHIQAFPNGELCYCGQHGCWDTVCSMRALLGDEDTDDFFSRLRSGDPARAEKWHTFLFHLGRLIKDLHLVNDVDIMLGGTLAPYFTDEDVDYLYARVRILCPFEEDSDFILRSRMPAYHIATGLALHYIHAFLEDVGREPAPDENL